ncbi:HPP family protein [Ancylobacter dichloromethanicus]|uniref:HPP transmembrane region domain-containing protein n=1 Tax=Ancylobacter dichloromethanicus TaxID=518825 RepID=A0A9W6JCX7_9HYPH|nr:HPP family protein [Ancylobacter dichloromethanicus]MBS7556415.1 HPP family protein [Ancylobacter dichloromethanicus]GLK73709.1 hypothetical protein GCM10017643_38270 [Ancylobacter dichloromethanicus]
MEGHDRTDGGERFGVAASILVAALSAAAVVFIVHRVAAGSGMALAAFPFITSLVLVCGAPASAPAGTRAILGGHLICGVVALGGLALFPPSDVVTAVAVGLAVALMLATRCFHPPAGITPLIVAQFQPGWDFLIWPVLTGALVAAMLARALERLRAGRSQLPR